MNFDIKNIKNLQIINFIKIKQALGTFLDTQNWGSKAKGPGPIWVKDGDD